jgi:diaminohydroxyphosphoribosylaminopyrimidine deaminase/5-amino-6-(5-phosphoribosylamino)uracil reductase
VRDDVLVICSRAEEQKKIALESRGIRVEQLPSSNPDGRPDIHAVLRRLGQLEIASLIIEGGSTVNAAALEAGIVDKVFLYYAPRIMAAAGAVPFVCENGLHAAREEIRLKRIQVHRFGEDFAVEGYLRDPYEE